MEAGDFQQQGLGQGYDVALVLGVLNGEPPEGRPALIGKVQEGLDPGGRMVLRDLVLDPDRADRPEAAMLALQMVLTTVAGGLATRDDWARWLAAAGFEENHTVALQTPGETMVTVERKPKGRAGQRGMAR